MAPTLIKITIPVGWTAFCDLNKNKAYGYSEFKKESTANTSLTLITKPTEAELKAELKARKISLPA